MTNERRVRLRPGDRDAATAEMVTGAATPLSDEACLLRLAAGHIEALSELVSRYQERVVNLIYRIVRDWDTALDLGQDVFVRIHERAATFNADSTAAPWILTVAVNIARDHARRRARIVSLDQRRVRVESAHLDPLEPMRGLEVEETRAHVWRVLGELSEEARELLLLREFERLSYEDLAVVLDCEIGTVKSRLHRARRAFELQFGAARGRAAVEGGRE